MPECYLDTNLVEVLLERSNSVNHKKGNSSVGAKMNDDKLSNSFIVGIIDDDKIKLRVLEEFEKIDRLSKKGLKLFLHPDKKHFFIQISPAIERWILTECAKAGIKLSRYDLPEDLNGLNKMKGSTQRNDERFRRLFRDMLINEKCDEIIELKRWLDFFKENDYKTNLDLL